MESIREIIVPDSNKLELTIPDHFIGKTIEVLAFEVGEKNNIYNNVKEKTFDAIKLNLSDFKFNREDANER
ncbi:MAG TPA: hypothetical protein VIJ92_10810 [Ginsengibacter sp.]